MNFEYPKFAVVGHPNKGKSSIVSVLAMDSSIQISDTPGTTSKKRSFPFKVDDKILYELIDTPGFQRGRRVLAWLEQHEVSADKKHQIVQKFINEHKNDERFHDEIELLEPLMDGAGIIYVVDGSKPYGKEYEADMEILRWTGQPSMALINHIDESDYSLEWKHALSQYFKLVRTFNPMDISMKQHLFILESMAQLKEEWTSSVKESIVVFKNHHEYKMQKSVETITKLLYDSLHLVEEISFVEENPTKEKKVKLQENYKKKLRNLEEKMHKKIEELWSHKGISKEKNETIFEEIDLFSEASASLFGLSKKDLAIRGAIAGAGVDLLFAGGTLFLGALVGGVGGYFGFEKLSDVKVLGQKLGKKTIQIGPMKNRNFPYVLLGRAIYHTTEIATFSHAKQGDEIKAMTESFKNRWLREDLKNSLNKYHQEFISSKEISQERLDEYEKIVREILNRLI